MRIQATFEVRKVETILPVAPRDAVLLAHPRSSILLSPVIVSSQPGFQPIWMAVNTDANTPQMGDRFTLTLDKLP